MLLVYSETWVKTFLHTTIRVKSQRLYKQPSYSQYQEYLYRLCRTLKDEGLGYRKISYRLNELGLNSVRGKVFKYGHVQSILNKGLVRKKRLESINSCQDNRYKIVYMNIELVKI